MHTLKPNDQLYLTLGEYNLKSKNTRPLTYFEKKLPHEKSGPTAAGIAGAAMALGNMQKPRMPRSRRYGLTHRSSSPGLYL